MLKFLGIGAQKSGTTWLYESLSHHPSVRFPQGKEVNFWNNLENEQEVAAYKKAFAADIALIEGEITPAYGHLAVERIQLIKDYFPHLKLIYIIRNPIERAWASASMALWRAEMTPHEASDQWFIDHFTSDGSLQRGDYQQNLKNWISVFGKESVLILHFEDIATDPQMVICNVLRHLKIDIPDTEVLGRWSLDKKVFPGPGYILPSNLREFLQDLYYEKIEALGYYLEIDLQAKWILSGAATSVTEPDISDIAPLQEIDNKAIIISGMHRSGTSLVASMMQSCGVFIGNNLLEAGTGNSIGHFEDLDFLAFHQEVLGQENRDGFNWVQSPSINDNQLELAKRLLAERAAQPLWGWKDPRTILFLDFWKQHIAELKTVLIYRHPVEVIMSLIKRATDWEIVKSPDKAIELWSRYNESILKFKQENPEHCVLVNISGVTADIGAFIVLIRSKFAVTLNQGEAAELFVEDKLTQFDWPNLSGQDLGEVFELSMALYTKLEANADISSNTSAHKELTFPWENFKGVALKNNEPFATERSSLIYLIAGLIDPSLLNNLFQASDIIINASNKELDKCIRLNETTLAERKSMVVAHQLELAKLNEMALVERKSMAAVHQQELDDLIKTVLVERQRLAAAHQLELDNVNENALLERESITAAHQLSVENLSSIHQLELNSKTSELYLANNSLTLAQLKKQSIESSRLTKLLQPVPIRIRQLTSVVRRIINRRPVPLFDFNWYRGNWPDLKAAQTHPYLHYSVFGWREGRDPNPYFDVIWYLQRYPDILQANIDPLQHYMEMGWREGRDPSVKFCTNLYLEKHPELRQQNVNPLQHYITQTDRSVSYAIPIEQSQHPQVIEEAPKKKEIKVQTARYEEAVTPDWGEGQGGVKVIAFYLPQFHPIPENDLFWGEGFTEWSNVTKAKPQFVGHDQPRLPSALGFYDLRLPEVMERQAKLARQYGIDGFCFHFYWFNGRRVLEKPVEQLLSNPNIDIEYCFNWANENWTKAWDGQDKDVLIEQHHSPEDDIEFIVAVIPYFEDPRYIRIDGKPVLMIYHPSLLPDAATTANRWREYCSDLGHELFLMVGETHDFKQERSPWYDAIVEYPPHRSHEPLRNAEYELQPDFNGRIYSYQALVDSYAPSPDTDTDCPVIKTVAPSWDNTPRRNVNAAIFEGSTPALYQQWLSQSLESTLVNNKPSHRMLFINAWNEWAEGAHLEPDTHYGHAYLNATAKALTPFRSAKPALLFVCHDATVAGAENVALWLLRWLKTFTAVEVRILILADGVMRPQFEALYPTYTLPNVSDPFNDETIENLNRFCGGKIGLVFLNTVVSAKVLPLLKKVKAPRLMYVHELNNSIEKYYGCSKFSHAVNEIDGFISVSESVNRNLIESYGIADEKTSIVKSFIPRPPEPGLMDKDKLKLKLGLNTERKIVLACGWIDWRKGPDLFIEVSIQLNALRGGDVDFIWVGAGMENYQTEHPLFEKNALDNNVIFVGEQNNVFDYYSVADVFLLTSREDPHPLVCLEAAYHQLPIIVFENSGGMPKFVNDSNCGYVVPFEDVQTMAEKTQLLLERDDVNTNLGQNGRNAVSSSFLDIQAGPKLLDVIRRESSIKPKVSIIVPIYNHARFLKRRLDSIYQQSFQDFEVILLDDASSDETASILAEYNNHAATKIFRNKINSGSPFTQWSEGISKANADIIWIAEDDDFCSESFLQELLPAFDDLSVNLAYCQSTAIDVDGNTLFSYMDYYKQAFSHSDKWEAAYKGLANIEVEQGLGIMNTIPNASGVLFRKFNIEQWKQKWSKARLAGDWAFYLHALQGGKVSFNPKHLNFHRRHKDTLTEATRNAELRFNEVARVHCDAINLYELRDAIKAEMREKIWAVWSETYTDQPRSEFDKYYDGVLES